MSSLKEKLMDKNDIERLEFLKIMFFNKKYVNIKQVCIMHNDGTKEYLSTKEFHKKTAGTTIPIYDENGKYICTQTEIGWYKVSPEKSLFGPPKPRTAKSIFTKIRYCYESAMEHYNIHDLPQDYPVGLIKKDGLLECFPKEKFDEYVPAREANAPTTQ